MFDQISSSMHNQIMKVLLDFSSRYSIVCGFRIWAAALSPGCLTLKASTIYRFEMRPQGCRQKGVNKIKISFPFFTHSQCINVREADFRTERLSSKVDFILQCLGLGG